MFVSRKLVEARQNRRRSSGPWIAFGLLMWAGSIFGGPAAAQVITLSSGAGTGLCLDVSGGGTSSGTNVQIYDCNGTISQRWTVTRRGELKSSVTSEMCLSIESGGSNVVIDACSDATTQRWDFDESGQLQSTSDKTLCLAATGTTSGSNAQVATCAGTSTQSWTAVATGAVNLFNGHDDLCLDVQGGGTSSGTNVQVYQCNGTISQQWTFGDNGVITSAVASGMCLDVQGGGTSSGTNVQIYTCNGTPSQTWTFATTSGLLASGVAPNRCLSEHEGNAEIQSCSGLPHQLWSPLLVVDLPGQDLSSPGSSEALVSGPKDPYRKLPCGIQCAGDCTSSIYGIGVLFNPVCYGICVAKKC